MTLAEREAIRQPERTKDAIRGCAEWLAACRRLGWRYEDLDFLEALWWKYHDERGNLISAALPAAEEG
jgi:hypothetical protein